MRGLLDEQASGKGLNTFSNNVSSQYFPSSPIDEMNISPAQDSQQSALETIPDSNDSWGRGSSRPPMPAVRSLTTPITRQYSLPTRTLTLNDMSHMKGIQRVDMHPFAIGGFADIWKGRKDGKLFAVKVLRTAWSDESISLKLKIRLEREAMVWSQLEHDYILPFSGICYDFTLATIPTLVSPYLKNGNVIVYLSCNPHLDSKDALKILWQAGMALEYLHGRRVVHGDVKGSNIMVDDEGNAKLADFGISRMLESSGTTTRTTGGTVRWMARELIFPDDNVEEDAAAPVTFESDVWSFGMTILEVLTGNLPFAELRNDMHVILKVAKYGLPRRPETFDDSIWNKLLRCWEVNTNERAKMSEINLYLWENVRSYRYRNGEEYTIEHASPYHREEKRTHMGG